MRHKKLNTDNQKTGNYLKGFKMVGKTTACSHLKKKKAEAFRLIVVIISQCIQILSHDAVHLKLIECDMPIILQLKKILKDVHK